MKALGLDYERLRRIKPDIILATVNAFGDGPWGAKIGFDGLAQAMSGNLYLSGEPGVPTRAFAPYVDYATASLSALSVMAALMHRDRSGEGQVVEGALLKTALTLMSPAILEQQQLGLDRPASLNRHPHSGPSDVFRTRDGWIMCMVLGDYQFRRWCELTGAEDLRDDPRFADDRLRGDHGEVLSERMAAWCETQTNASALEALEAARVPARAGVLAGRGAHGSARTAARLLFDARLPRAGDAGAGAGFSGQAFGIGRHVSTPGADAG